MNAELLHQKIDGSGLKLGYIAAQLGMTPVGFSRKLKLGTEFKPTQINTLCDLLRIVDPNERKEIFLI